MADDLETNVRTAVEKLAKALADASSLTVETRYVLVAADKPDNLDNSRLAAQTVIQLDGDQAFTVPVQRQESGELSLDTELLELHMRNVSTAIEYRSNMLNTLLSLVKPRLR